MTTRPAAGGAGHIKACCAAAYGSDLVARLLGESYHPGGPALTRRLANLLALRPGQRVLDVAAGPGATAQLLAREYGAQVHGVDLNPALVARARAAVEHAGLADTAHFHVGDAERIPMSGGQFDAIVCECALCTFPHPDAAAAEFARLLNRGGRVGIADVTVGPGRLPAQLTDVTGWVACLAGARPLAEHVTTLARAGLRTIRTEPHHAALRTMIGQIHARLALLRTLHADPLAGTGIAIDTALQQLRLADTAITTGLLGYSLIIARKTN